MRHILPLLFLLCSPLSAQNIVSVESQDVILAAFVNLGSPVHLDYNVQNYKILYTTTDALGQPDTASGPFTTTVRWANAVQCPATPVFRSV